MQTVSTSNSEVNMLVLFSVKAVLYTCIALNSGYGKRCFGNEINI